MLILCLQNSLASLPKTLDIDDSSSPGDMALYKTGEDDYLEEQPYSLGQDGSALDPYAMASDINGGYASRNLGFYSLGLDSGADHYQATSTAGNPADDRGFYHNEQERDLLYSYRGTSDVAYAEPVAGAYGSPQGTYESPYSEVAAYIIPTDTGAFYSVLQTGVAGHCSFGAARPGTQAVYAVPTPGHYSLGNEGAPATGIYSLGMSADPGGSDYHLATETDGPGAATAIYTLAASVEDPSC